MMSGFVVATRLPFAYDLSPCLIDADAGCAP